jgi:hypothetical protein
LYRLLWQKPWRRLYVLPLEIAMKSVSLFTFVAACALSACSADAPPPPQAATQPAQKTVIDTQLKALQKAKDVQNVVDDQKKRTDKTLEDQGG